RTWISTAGAPRSASAACWRPASTAMRWSATKTMTAASTATSTAGWAPTSASTRTGASTATSSSTATSPSGSWVPVSPGNALHDPHVAGRALSRSAMMTPAQGRGLFLCVLGTDQAAGVLGLLLAREQARQALGRGDVAVEHGAHVAGDRQLDAVGVGLAHDLVGGLHRLHHLADLAHGVLQALPAAERQAQAAVAREVAGAGQHQVAQAGQPHEGLGAPADGGVEAQH